MKGLKYLWLALALLSGAVHAQGISGPGQGISFGPSTGSGVTKLTAGNGIVLSPSGGTGTVAVSVGSADGSSCLKFGTLSPNVPISTTLNTLVLGCSNAGAAFPYSSTSDIYPTVIIGADAAQSLTSTNAEGVFIGALSAQFLISGGLDTCVGMHSCGSITVDSNVTAVGDDAIRDATGGNLGGSVAVGTHALAHGNPGTNTAIGLESMNGQSMGIVVGGTPKTGDIVNVTIAKTSASPGTLTGFPFTASYTVQSTDTTLAMVAAGLAGTINGLVNNGAGVGVGPSYFIGADANSLGDGTAVVTLQFPGAGCAGASCTGGTGWALSGVATVGGPSPTDTLTVIAGSTESGNTAVGKFAMFGAAMTNPQNDTVAGDGAGMSITSGSFNTLIGTSAGISITSGTNNTIVGFSAGDAITTGSSNLFFGMFAGRAIGGASNGNIIVGQNAVGTSTATISNDVILGSGAGINLGAGANGAVLIGQSVAPNMTSAVDMVVIGFGAGGSETTGGDNTFVGYNAGNAVSTTTMNTLIGSYAGFQASGSGNTIVGQAAGIFMGTSNNNTIMGMNIARNNVTTGNGNVIIGAGQSGCDLLAAGNSNEIDICGSASAPVIIVTGTNTPATEIGTLAGMWGFSGNAPAVSACGTTPAIDSNATNNSGTVTVGSGVVASCTVTMANSGFPTYAHCRVTPQTSSAAFAYSYTKAVITVTATSLTSLKFDYSCDGK